jgi:hypothetical protein
VTAANPLADRLRKASRPPMVKVAPGLYVKEPAADGVVEMCIGRFVPEADGQHYRFVPLMENMVRVDARVLKMIGMERQMKTLERLGRGGFIEVVRVAPHTTLLNLESWYGHVARCAEEGEEYWSERRVREYRRAL